MDKSSIMNDSFNQPSLPVLYKKNIELDPRFDLCLQKVKFKFSEKGMQMSPECSICMGSFGLNELCRRIISCKHLFHEECIKKYLKVNEHRCPICYQIIDLTSITNDQLQNSENSLRDNKVHDV